MDKGKLRLKLPASRTRIFARISSFDLSWACLSPIIAFFIRDGTLTNIESAAIYCATAIIASLICFQIFKISAPLEYYFSAYDAIEVAKPCLITVVFTAVIAFTFVRTGNSPRSVPILHFFILLSGLLAQRSLHRLFETSRAASHAFENNPTTVQQNIIILQASRLAWFYTKMVEELAHHRTRIVAVLDTRPEFFGRSMNGYAVVGSPSHITRIIDEYSIHGMEIHKLVVAARPDELPDETWMEIQAFCSNRNIIMESLYEFVSSPSSDRDHVAPPLPAHVDSYATVFASPYWKIKRPIDIVLSVIALIIFFPPAILVTGCVLLDVGLPILFWQQRVGYLGRPLFLLKFRTMRAPYDRNGDPVKDSRTSGLGRFLRAIRVDEIPQLVNILSGHMSLIGPRPLLPIDQPENIEIRLHVRPGLTGLAQVNGGKLLTPEEKDVLDDWYIRHASLCLDIRILARTVWVVLGGDRRNEGAIDAASFVARDHTN
jgi:lipopolysaccharide/colanic/teichoic acid biosynthesis glycosyltransferase